jgi:hypothetical protein
MKAVHPSGTVRWLKWGIAIALALLVYVHFKPRHVRMPAELVGTWKSTNSLYADRSLDIGQESITFGTGLGTETTGFVDDIETLPEDGKTLYTISYSSDGMPGKISVYYAPAEGETLRLLNQEQVVWKKQKD